MKNKIFSAILCGLLIICLVGCDAASPIKSESSAGSTVSADGSSDNESSGDILAEPTASVESENPSDSASETQILAEEKESPAESSSPEQTSEARTPARTEEQKPAQSSSIPIESSKQEPQPTELPKPRPTEPTEPEPPQETEKPTEPPAPEFDINHWISYAKDYAAGIGLELDSEAVECWDNPITAGAECIYLQRDIESRLNRYHRDEDITAVWIWAEQRANGDYDLYIGYA